MIGKNHFSNERHGKELYFIPQGRIDWERDGCFNCFPRKIPVWTLENILIRQFPDSLYRMKEESNVADPVDMWVVPASSIPFTT